jgi:hypothetical protein
VASLSVVLLEPGCKSLGSRGVAGEDLPAGPLGGQGPVEALELAVLPGAVGLDELLPGPDGGHCCGEVVALAVVQGVVAQDPLDPGDAVTGEVGGGPGQERGGGAFSSGRISQ